jgi:hypothetical protein
MVLPYLKGLIVIKEIFHIVLVYLLWCFCIQSLVLNMATRYLGQTAEFIFSASEMGHGLDPFQELGDSRGYAKKTGPWPSTLHGHLPALWC